MKLSTHIYFLLISLPLTTTALLPPQKLLAKPSRSPAMPPAAPSTSSSPETGTSITLSDAMGSDRSIHIFAGFTRDFAPISQRLEDAQLRTTILAPRNSAIMALDRKPWEDPTGQDYAAFGAEAYEGAEGRERARDNLRRFVEAHVVERSPWPEGEKVSTRGGETVWWNHTEGVRVVRCVDAPEGRRLLDGELD
ncbi:hypothetical protein BUE80_DR010488 [Diplocarpon rosae]|nr:hypothetical protein BUE80_DR010488 [Diplocarpon rosae]